MLRAWILTPLLLTPLLLSEAPAPTPPSFEILTSVRPSNVGPVQLLRLATPGTLHCTAVVLRHPGASEPLATMETYIVPDWRGTPSLQITYRDVGSLRIGFIVSSPDPHRVTTSVTVSEDGRIIARHASEVWLPARSQRRP